MKRLLLLSCFWLLDSPVSHAIIDENQNGISDLYEKARNNGQLYALSIDPAADSDGDGWNLIEESVANTDPDSGSAPLGIVKPLITIIEATYWDPDSDDIPDVLTPKTARITWPSLAGKKYTVQYSSDLKADSWNLVDGEVVEDGAIINQYVILTQPDGSIPPSLFFKVAITDRDEDNDGLTTAEELILGTNPNSADTDGDGLNDALEIANGTNPSSSDSDGDSKLDGEDASPRDGLIDWLKTPDYKYLWIPAPASLNGFVAVDCNDKGQILFRNTVPPVNYNGYNTAPVAKVWDPATGFSDRYFNPGAITLNLIKLSAGQISIVPEAISFPFTETPNDAITSSSALPPARSGTTAISWPMSPLSIPNPPSPARAESLPARVPDTGNMSSAGTPAIPTTKMKMTTTLSVPSSARIAAT